MVNKLIWKSALILFSFISLVIFPGFSEKDEIVVIANKRNFIIIGDTQRIGFWESLYWDYWSEHNKEKTKLLFKEIAREEPDFILHLGDLTRDGGNDTAWNEFDEDYQFVKEKGIPVFPVFGNHEYFGNEETLLINWNKRFPQIKGRKWYSLDYDELGIIMFNSNFDELNENDKAEQLKWYAEKLHEMETDNRIKKIIVAGHHPPFTNSKIVNPNLDVAKYYVEPFEKTKKGILFFSGHCHSYEKFVRSGKYFIVSGGGGGPRQKLNTNKLTRKFDDKFNGPVTRFFHFCKLSVNQDSIYLDVVGLDKGNHFIIKDNFRFKK